MTPEDRAAAVVYGPRGYAVASVVSPDALSLLYQAVVDAIRSAERGARTDLAKSVLPRFLELCRYRSDREGTAATKDFADVEAMLRAARGDE